MEEARRPLAAEPHPDPSARRSRPRVVALMNQKGGVGKTTTTVNLAAAVAALGHPTLIIDLDPQAHASLHLGVDQSTLERSVYDVFLDPEIDAARCMLNVRPGLDLLPAEVDLAAVETELADGADRHRRLQRGLASLGGKHEFVFIDCPPSLGLLTLNALAAADEVLVPMQAHFLALQGVSKLLETVALVARSLNESLRVRGVVLCAHDENTTHAREVVADLEQFFESARAQGGPWSDGSVLRPAVRRNIKLAECPSFGQTIFEYAPWCPGALDYRKLAEGLIEQWQSSDTEAPAAPVVTVTTGPKAAV